MNIQSIGILVKQQREALGITQSKLAALTNTSRTTINELETGKIKELGASKLFNVLHLLGLSLSIDDQEPLNDKKILKQITQSANVSYQNILSPFLFSRALSTGKIPSGLEGNFLYFFDEAPYSSVNQAICAVAHQHKMPPKTIRRIAKRMAQEMKSPREIWYD
jgi:transcriptional regulator with XRE-family HTH domain